jgi:hypothetical protein
MGRFDCFVFGCQIDLMSTNSTKSTIGHIIEHKAFT